MSRLTRKPRLFGSPARRAAGASAMLLALASELAAAQNPCPDAAPPLNDPHEAGAPLAAVGTTNTHLPKATGPLGWTAAGVLLALALCPSGLVRSMGDA